jgi:hypothetical protein
MIINLKDMRMMKKKRKKKVARSMVVVDTVVATEVAEVVTETTETEMTIHTKRRRKEWNLRLKMMKMSTTLVNNKHLKVARDKTKKRI